MKTSKLQKAFLMAAALLLAIFLAGCSAGSSPGDHAPAQDSLSQEQESQENGESGASTSIASGVITAPDSASQKLIYTGSMEIESEQFEEDYQLLKDQIAAMGGYLSGEYVSGTAPTAYGDSGRYAQITARIPADQFTPFLNYADGQLKVVQKNIEVEDITQSYYDNETRIELLELRYAKLEEHLRGAEKMEDIITLEKEMSEILSELDTLKGTRRHMDDQVSYSTLRISLCEVVRASNVGLSDESITSRMGNAFHSTWRSIGVFFEDFAVFFVGALPVLLILGALALAIFLLIRLGQKRRRAKSAQKTAAEPKNKKE